MKPKRKLVFFLSAALLLGLTAAFLFWLTLPSPEFIRLKSTLSNMRDFDGLVTRYIVTHGKIPGRTLAESLETIRHAGDKYFDERRCKMVIENRDAWGEPFIYEVSSDGKTITFRSKGANRQDDHGKNDDIQYVIDVSVLE